MRRPMATRVADLTDDVRSDRWKAGMAFLGIVGWLLVLMFL